MRDREHPFDGGSVLLLTVTKESPALGAVWKLYGGAPELRDAAFGKEAQRAWRTAVTAINRVAPMVPTTLIPLQTASIRARLVASGDGRGERRVPNPKEGIDGASFGLAFLLAIYGHLTRTRPVVESHEVDEPLFAATARVFAGGELGVVQGVEEKAKALCAHLDEIDRDGVLFVHADQVEAARRAAEAFEGVALQVVGVTTAAEAVACCLPHGTDGWLAGAAAPDALSSTIDGFFDTAMGGRYQLVDWSPLDNAIGLIETRIAETNLDLAPLQQLKLSFAREVAKRHDGHDVPAHLLNEEQLGELLDALMAPDRLTVLANRIQLATDSGGISEDIVATYAARVPEDDRDCYPGHAKMIGALGRYKASRGELSQAVTVGERAVGIWQRLREPTEASHPISAMYLAVDAMRGEDAKEELKRTDARWAELEPHFGAVGAPTTYVDAAWARAHLRHGNGESQASARATLQRLCAERNIAAHIRLQAARLLALDVAQGVAPAIPASIRVGCRSEQISLQLAARTNFGMLCLSAALRGTPVSREAASEAVDVASGGVAGSVTVAEAYELLREVRGSFVDAIASGAEGREAHERVARLFPY